MVIAAYRDFREQTEVTSFFILAITRTRNRHRGKNSRGVRVSTAASWTAGPDCSSTGDNGRIRSAADTQHEAVPRRGGERVSRRKAGAAGKVRLHAVPAAQTFPVILSNLSLTRGEGCQVRAGEPMASFPKLPPKTQGS